VRLAIAYNTMNKLELTKQTFPVLRDGQHALLWSDGSTDPAAIAFFEQNCEISVSYAAVRGGADSAIVHSLTRLLRHPANYTHVGLVENDVMLDDDWLEPTIALFEQGTADGLRVGAVSARSFEDRVLFQRDAYAVMFNLGAGMIVMTRDAAEIVLHTFATGWWPTTRRVFAQLSGVDLATHACFRGNEQYTTSDWQYDMQLARHGYASLALTPSKASMIGQVPSLREQGLVLTRGPVESRRDEKLFDFYRSNLQRLGPCVDGRMLSDGWSVLRRDGNGLLVFPHQIGCLSEASWQGNLKLHWTNGFGPFSYVAGPGGAYLSVHISGISQFLVSGGDAGARVTITDTRSGFRTSPELPAGDQPIAINVPGGPIPRTISMDLAEGAVFYGLQTADPQVIDTTWKFDWSQLPEAK
jgi:hypothetical protein